MSIENVFSHSIIPSKYYAVKTASTSRLYSDLTSHWRALLQRGCKIQLVNPALPLLAASNPKPPSHSADHTASF